MKVLNRYVQGNFKIFSNFVLQEPQLQQIAKLISAPTLRHAPGSQFETSHDHGLGGRAVMYGGEIDAIGPVILKTYRRGGFLKLLLETKYLRLGQSRSRSEYKILQRVRQLGINAPEPVAYIEEGEMWYRAWLITKEIPSQESFIRLSDHNMERAIKVGHQVAKQIGLLISNRIHHVDLHPGNIVVASDDQVYIVDFDKAHDYTGRRNELRDQYLRRWRRAVIKHKLPEILCEAVSLDLRDNYD